MKNIILLSVLFILFAVAATAMSVNVYQYDYNQKNAGFIVVIVNHDDSMRDGKATLDIPELGSVSRTESFEADRDEAKRLYYDVDMPSDVEPDYYPVRIVVTDDDGNKKRSHSWVFIGN